MATSTIEAKQKFEKVGLVEDHTFTLISAREATISGKKERLLKIRNPWGNHELNGKWSDKSNAWTKEAKKAFNL